MKIPTMRMTDFPTRTVPADTLARGQSSEVRPSGCCAKACIETPLGKVCHCVHHVPFC